MKRGTIGLAALLTACGGGGGGTSDPAGLAANTHTSPAQAQESKAAPTQAPVVAGVSTQQAAPAPTCTLWSTDTHPFTCVSVAPHQCSNWASVYFLPDFRPTDKAGNRVSNGYCQPALTGGLLHEECVCVG